MKFLRLIAVVTAWFGVAGGTSLFAEDWTTLDGASYKDVKVIKVEDDAVTILYRDGGALVRFFRLSPALQARFHYDPDKARAAAAARTKADADNRAAISRERVQAEELRAARDAKYKAEQTAAHAAVMAANDTSSPGLPVAAFLSLDAPPDSNHHTMGETAQQMRLMSPPDPNRRAPSEALSTNDPDLPVMPQ